MIWKYSAEPTIRNTYRIISKLRNEKFSLRKIGSEKKRQIIDNDARSLVSLANNYLKIFVSKLTKTSTERGEFRSRK